MSQIVKSSQIFVDDIEMAINVANENKFIYEKNAQISGIGKKNVEHKFSKNNFNFGLTEFEQGKFDIFYDTDYKNKVVKDFIIPYSIQKFQQQALNNGNQFSMVENDGEIFIELQF